MRTLKNTKKDAGLLMAIFLGICIGLDRDEIFFWSRSEEAFKKLFLRPVSELTELGSKPMLSSKRQHRLDESPYQSQVDLLRIFVEVCGSLSREQVLFWLKPKSRGVLASLLQKDEIDFLPAAEGAAFIPELPAGTTAKTFRSKNFRQNQYQLYDACQSLYSKYEKTEACEVHCFGMACALSGDEMIAYAGGTDAIADVSFTPEQIRYLASEQRRKRDTGLLLYKGSNYFPVLGKDKVLRLVSLQWSAPSFPGDDKIGRWYYWVLATSYQSRGNGRFFIKG